MNKLYSKTLIAYEEEIVGFTNSNSARNNDEDFLEKSIERSFMKKTKNNSGTKKNLSKSLDHSHRNLNNSINSNNHNYNYNNINVPHVADFNGFVKHHEEINHKTILKYKGHEPVLL